MIYLIGAGPGDPDLITVAGLKALQASTAVVYDALVSEAVLDLAPPTALRIPMGKRGHAPSADQDDINGLMIRLEREGYTVARLKGGDPLVFARVGEEMLALAQAGVPFKLIPGVSSAVAGPAAAHIPLTYRNLAASFAVVTAHRVHGADAPDWSALAKIDTVVILMGATHLDSVAEALMVCGRDPKIPAAAIQSASLADERIVYASLGGLADAVSRAGLSSPLIIVVGQVVRIGEEIRQLALGLVREAHGALL